MIEKLKRKKKPKGAAYDKIDGHVETFATSITVYNLQTNHLINL